MTDKEILSSMVGFIGGLLVTLALCHTYMTHDAIWQDQAVKSVCGRHNKISGEFQWIDSIISNQVEE